MGVTLSLISTTFSIDLSACVQASSQLLTFHMWPRGSCELVVFSQLHLISTLVS